RKARKPPEDPRSKRLMVFLRPERVLFGAARVGVHRQMSEEVPALLAREPCRLRRMRRVRDHRDRERTVERGEKGPRRRVESDVVDDDGEDASRPVIDGLEVGRKGWYGPGRDGRRRTRS